MECSHSAMWLTLCWSLFLKNVVTVSHFGKSSWCLLISEELINVSSPIQSSPYRLGWQSLPVCVLDDKLFYRFNWSSYQNNRLACKSLDLAIVSEQRCLLLFKSKQGRDKSNSSWRKKKALLFRCCSYFKVLLLYCHSWALFSVLLFQTCNHKSKPRLQKLCLRWLEWEGKHAVNRTNLTHAKTTGLRKHCQLCPVRKITSSICF